MGVVVGSSGIILFQSSIRRQTFMDEYFIK